MSLDDVQLLDCDVEEPDSHIFLDIALDKVEDVNISIPVVAIGGITAKNIEEVMRAGADSTVAISDVVTSDDVFGKIAELRQKMRIR